MKVKIVQNKYLNAIFLLMLFSAIVHMLILFFVALISKDLYVLNYFNIISVSYFVPNFLNSLLGNAISLVFVVLLYFFILKMNNHE